MTDVLQTIATVVAVASGVTGLVLGIRAERRAEKYVPLWVAEPGRPVRFRNRTGEDAINVRLEVVSGRVHSNRTAFGHVGPDAHFEVMVSPEEGKRTTDFFVYWTRAKTGRTYKSGEDARARRKRWGAERRSQ